MKADSIKYVQHGGKESICGWFLGLMPWTILMPRRSRSSALLWHQQPRCCCTDLPVRPVMRYNEPKCVVCDKGSIECSQVKRIDTGSWTQRLKTLGSKPAGSVSNHKFLIDFAVVLNGGYQVFSRVPNPNLFILLWIG